MSLGYLGIDSDLLYVVQIVIHCMKYLITI